MLDQCIDNRATAKHLRSNVIGLPLDSFTEHLTALGYAAATVRAQLTLLGHLDRWMARRRWGIAELSDQVINRFVHDRARRGQLRRGDAVTVHRFLAHLRAHGVVGSPTPVVDDSALGRLQQQYEQHLTSERGLAPATVTNYRGCVRWFLTERFGDGPMDLRDLDVSAITKGVVRYVHSMSPGRAKLMVTALRSLFRFLVQRGAIERDLSACVPRVADWRLATIPKYGSSAESVGDFRLR
jgi:site-specific recombinase XerD